MQAGPLASSPVGSPHSHPLKTQPHLRLNELEHTGHSGDSLRRAVAPCGAKRRRLHARFGKVIAKESGRQVAPSSDASISIRQGARDQPHLPLNAKAVHGGAG